MTKNKLDSIKNLYQAQERALGRDLQRTVAERAQTREQEDNLRDLLGQYRQEHVQTTQWSAQQAARFQRFYQQLMSALTAQGELTRRLTRAEALQRDAWRAAYQRRLGLERVIDKQAVEQEEVAKRRERRATNKPVAGSLTTLNAYNKETDQ